MRWTAWMLLLWTSVVVAGCATPTPDWCDTNEAWRLTSDEWDAAGDDLRRQIVVHNEYGEELCGWEP